MLNSLRNAERTMSYDPKATGLAGRARRRNGFPLSTDKWRTIARTLRLSNRELEIVQGVFNGGTEVSIAQDLKLSAHTVHSHVDRLYKKLQIQSRSALVLRVFAEYLTLEPARGAGGRRSDKARLHAAGGTPE